MGQRAHLGERMATACLREPLDQRIGLGVQEQYAQVDGTLAKLSDPGRQLFQGRTAAYVYADRDASIAFLRKEIDEARQQIDRQVVDAVVPAIFQHLERYALAGARHAG